MAKAAGYPNWYNAAGADLAKIKAGDKETGNHYANNLPGTVVNPEMIREQVKRYDDPNDEKGHLYGAIERQRGQFFQIDKITSLLVIHPT